MTAASLPKPSHFLLAALLGLLALGATACDCDPEPRPNPCHTSADCAADQTCRDSRCVSRSDAGTHTPLDGAPGDADFVDALRVLTIEPLDPVLDVDGSPQTLAFTARVGSREIPTVSWTLSDVVLGTIAESGIFTANGLTAGRITLTARYGELSATTTITVRVRISTSEEGLTLPADVIESLRTGGSADPQHRWLYPYDETVFPRGLSSPVFQLGGTGADAIRLTIDIAERDYHYEGFFGARPRVQVELPREVWDAVTESAGAGHRVVVGATKISGAAVSGPAIETLYIAQGRLTGSIFYNTYASPLASGGAVMRVPLGRDAEVVQASCTVCHSVSANGNRIATGLGWSDTMTITGTGNPIQSGNIELTSDGAATPGRRDPDGRKYSFAALTPNGDYLVNNAIPRSGGIRGLSGSIPSQLHDASTGEAIAAPSWTVPYAVTPQFAADGSAIAFTWFPDDGSNNPRSLGVASFDVTTSPPTFGAPRRVVTITDTSRIVGWPAFTPDAQAVIFQNATAFDTSLGGGTGSSNRPVWSDLHLVDLTRCNASGEECEVVSLDRLNGSDAGGFYLPYGEGEEAHSNYEPTILPVAVGGYYWVVFTSRRCYGNLIAPGGTLAGGEDRWGHRTSSNAEIPSARKKLWIAAIDLSGGPGADRSHPAFYLSGQEFESGNMRGFAALDACHMEGDTCTSAADCCGGFCRDVSGGGDVPDFRCVPPPGDCSEELEACDTAADCCGVALGARCINHRCAEDTVH